MIRTFSVYLLSTFSIASANAVSGGTCENIDFGESLYVWSGSTSDGSAAKYVVRGSRDQFVIGPWEVDPWEMDLDGPVITGDSAAPLFPSKLFSRLSEIKLKSKYEPPSIAERETFNCNHMITISGTAKLDLSETSLEDFGSAVINLRVQIQIETENGQASETGYLALYDRQIARKIEITRPTFTFVSFIKKSQMIPENIANAAMGINAFLQSQKSSGFSVELERVGK